MVDRPVRQLSGYDCYLHEAYGRIRRLADVADPRPWMSQLADPEYSVHSRSHRRSFRRWYALTREFPGPYVGGPLVGPDA
jgi:hypothetical protein